MMIALFVVMFVGKKRLEESKIIREHMPYGKVLVVDDVRTNLYVAEGLLAAYGLNVETASSGFEAIEKAENGKTYDMIFMDHMMPLMDGIETTQKLRAMEYKGVIVALTANALVGNDEMFKQNGFDDFISKPINAHQLNACLNKYIRDRHPEEAEKHKPVTSALVQFDEKNPKLLEIFRRDAGKAIITLRETLADGDVKMFTTTAHAMKSALANIGESDASEMAFALENAGLDGDLEFISRNTERFIEMLDILIKRFHPPEAVNESKAETPEDTTFLMEQLQIIKTACDDYDDTAAYAALDRLKEKPWKIETSSAIEQIRDMLFLHSDFEGAAERVSRLLEEWGDAL
jgi:CheY-like chemotaxis protein/HPt (histidine-containing phosphotransfer) domain-containing protein